jgi:hypothetical protein
MGAKDDFFKPQPTYTESTTANKSWINVTVVKTDGDGNVTQVSSIVSKK